MNQSASRKQEQYSPGRYVPLAQELLARHGLAVPAGTVHMVAKTIWRCRTDRAMQKVQMRPRLRAALSHAKRLRRYCAWPPSRADSSEKQSRALLNLLHVPQVATELSLATPRIEDLGTILCILTSGACLVPIELDQLIKSLESVLSRPGVRSGRPLGELASVIRGACIAWQRSGRPDSYNTWPSEGMRFEGPLAEFMRDFLSECRLSMGDSALCSAAKAARRSLSGHSLSRARTPRDKTQKKATSRP
jgi:hypothetical protein